MDEIFLIFSVNDLVTYFKNNESHFYIFFGALLEKNCEHALSIFLDNDQLFVYLMKSMDTVSSVMSNLSYESVMTIIKKMNDLHMEKESYSFVRMLNKEDQKKLLDEINDLNVLALIIKCMDNNTQKDFFLHDDRAKLIYTKFNVVALSENGIVFNQDILNNPVFFSHIKSLDISLMRRSINSIENTNPNNHLRESVLHYYDELISEYDKEKQILHAYDTQFTDFEYAKEPSAHLLSDIVIDALFEDNLNNVTLNIKEMLRYNEKLDEKILNEEKISFYQMILNIESLDNEQKIALYNNYKNKNIYTEFYLDLRKLKDKSYESLNQSLFKAEKQVDCFIGTVKEQFGVDIYDLRDKEYTMLVRCLQRPFEEIARTSRDCYTLISNNNNTVMSDDGYIYGYQAMDINRVLHVNESDSFSTWNYDAENTTKHINRIMTKEEITSSIGDLSYSEIQIQNKKDENGNYISMKPDYLIAYDMVSKDVLEESKRLYIPICILKHELIKEQPVENQGKYIA